MTFSYRETILKFCLQLASSLNSKVVSPVDSNQVVQTSWWYRFALLAIQRENSTYFDVFAQHHLQTVMPTFRYVIGSRGMILILRTKLKLIKKAYPALLLPRSHECSSLHRLALMEKAQSNSVFCDISNIINSFIYFLFFNIFYLLNLIQSQSLSKLAY